MPRRLAQQRMTLSDLQWSFTASHAISAVAELLVSIPVLHKHVKYRRKWVYLSGKVMEPESSNCHVRDEET